MAQFEKSCFFFKFYLFSLSSSSFYFVNSQQDNIPSSNILLQFKIVVSKEVLFL